MTQETITEFYSTKQIDFENQGIVNLVRKCDEGNFDTLVALALYKNIFDKFYSVDRSYSSKNQSKIEECIENLVINNPHDYRERAKLTQNILENTSVSSVNELFTLLKCLEKYDGKINVLNDLCEKFNTYNLEEVSNRIQFSVILVDDYKDTKQANFDLDSEFIGINAAGQRLSKNGRYVILYQDPLIKDSASPARHQLVSKLSGILFKDRELPDFSPINREVEKRLGTNTEIEIEKTFLRDVFSIDIYKKCKLKLLENITFSNLLENKNFIKLLTDYPKIASEVKRFKELEILLENGRAKDLRLLKKLFEQNQDPSSQLLRDTGKTINNWYKDKIEKKELPKYIEETYYRFIHNIGTEAEKKRNQSALIAYQASNRVIKTSLVLKTLEEDVQSINELMNSQLNQNHPLYALQQSGTWDEKFAKEELQKITSAYGLEIPLHEVSNLINDFSICGQNIMEIRESIARNYFSKFETEFNKVILFARDIFQGKTSFTATKLSGKGYECKKDCLDGSIPDRITQHSVFGRKVEINGENKRVLEHSDWRALFDLLLLSELRETAGIFKSFSIKGFQESISNAIYAYRKANILINDCREAKIDISGKTPFTDKEIEEILVDFFESSPAAIPKKSWKRDKESKVNKRIIGFAEELDLPIELGKTPKERCQAFAKILKGSIRQSSDFLYLADDIKLLEEGFFTLSNKHLLEAAALRLKNLVLINKSESEKYIALCNKLLSSVVFIGDTPFIPNDYTTILRSGLITKDLQNTLKIFEKFKDFESTPFNSRLNILGFDLSLTLKSDSISFKKGKVLIGKINPDTLGIKSHEDFNYIDSSEITDLFFNKEANYFSLSNIRLVYGNEMGSKFISFLEDKIGEKIDTPHRVNYHSSIITEFFYDVSPLRVKRLKQDKIFEFELSEDGEEITIKIRGDRKKHAGKNVFDVEKSYFEFLSTATRVSEATNSLAKLCVRIRDLSEEDRQREIHSFYMWHRNEF